MVAYANANQGVDYIDMVSFPLNAAAHQARRGAEVPGAHHGDAGDLLGAPAFAEPDFVARMPASLKARDPQGAARPGAASAVLSFQLVKPGRSGSCRRPKRRPGPSSLPGPRRYAVHRSIAGGRRHPIRPTCASAPVDVLEQAGGDAWSLSRTDPARRRSMADETPRCRPSRSRGSSAAGRRHGDRLRVAWPARRASYGREPGARDRPGWDGFIQATRGAAAC